MRLSSIDRLCCPVCLLEGAEASYEVDPTRVGGGEDGGAVGDLLEAFLVCRRCRAARPVLGGVPIVVADLAAHLVDHGNVYRRAPIADPRVTRFVLGGAGSGGDVVPFDEVVGRYGDLLPASDAAPARALSPYDAALDVALVASGARGPALEIGCGVGRGTFVLAARVGDATGLDRSIARIRRARNVQIAEEFHLPEKAGARIETPIDLARLARDATDFVVGGPDPLPFARRTFGVVVLREGDGDGAWARPAAAAREEAERVVVPGGLLFVERTTSAGPTFEATPATALA